MVQTTRQPPQPRQPQAQRQTQAQPQPRAAELEEPEVTEPEEPAPPPEPPPLPPLRPPEDVSVYITPGMQTATLEELLVGAGIVSGVPEKFEEMRSQLSGLQAQVDTLNASLQEQIDALRAHLEEIAPEPEHPEPEHPEQTR